jgi:hypothetical protein
MQLREMLTALRAECGLSTNVAHGLNDRESMVYLLDRTQLDLWEAWDWPFLTVDRDIALGAGTMEYAYPADLSYETITDAWIVGNNQLYRLEYGIQPIDQVVVSLPSWPPRHWRHDVDTGQIMLWPIPDQSATGCTLKLRGTKIATRLINDSDESTLPWRIIVLTAAAEVLAKQQDPAAQTKATRAAELIRRLKARTVSHKSRFTPLGGHVSRMPRVGLDYVPSGYGQGPRRV